MTFVDCGHEPVISDLRRLESFFYKALYNIFLGIIYDFQLFYFLLIFPERFQTLIFNFWLLYSFGYLIGQWFWFIYSFDTACGSIIFQIEDIIQINQWKYEHDKHEKHSKAVSRIKDRNGNACCCYIIQTQNPWK